MPGTTTLQVVREGAVCWVTLSRPEVLNALNDQLVEELWTFFDGIAHDPTCRIIVLRGAGAGFCAGMDLRSFSVLQDGASGEGGAARSPASLSGIIARMRACPQPVIALVHGAACGGGFSIALAADIRIAGASAKMNVAYVTLGLSGCELGTSYFLPRLVGPSIAAELMMTGRFIRAQRALATGLVSEVTADDEMEAAARQLIGEMLATSPIGLRKTKETLALSAGLDDLVAVMNLEEHVQLQCMRDPAFKAAVTAFAQRPKGRAAAPA